MKILHLALANIRSGRSATLSLFILIAIAGLLLNVGLTVLVKMDSFFDEKAEELHEPHISMLMQRENEQAAYNDFLRNQSGVTATEEEHVILMNGAKFRYEDSDLSLVIALLHAEAPRDLASMKLIEKLDGPAQAGDIHVPLSFRASAGYQLGDTFTLTFQDQEYSYRIAGFFETMMMGTPNVGGIMKFFLPDESYRQLEERTGETADGTMLSARLQNPSEAMQVLDAFNKEFPDQGMDVTAPLFWQIDIEMVKSVGSMTINIVAMILVAFAAVIVLVSLLVIQFRVTNSIDEGIVNIGVLKAVGYTSRQIVASIVLQFMLVTLSGGIVGAAVSYAIIPVFGGIITTLSGLLWHPSFDAVINASSVLTVAVLVLAVALVSTVRIRNLHPVTALRGGIRTHSFKKSWFPLDRSAGGLQFLLACKTMMTNMKQNVMIGCVIAAITFASIFSVVLYYNIASDKTAFVHLVGAETSNVIVYSKSAEDSEKLLTAIGQMDGVSKTAILDMASMKMDGHNVYTTISDDYSKLENQMVYDGRYPKYDNEVAVTWVVAKMLGKEVGDTVQVEAGDGSYSYLITGLSQSISNMGHSAYLTIPGVQHILPGYTGSAINVYLDGVENDSFMRQIKEQYGQSTSDVIDVEETISAQTSIYTSAVFAIMVIVLAITVLVVALILYLVIKKMILKRKKELGILKATGYTTMQLMTQISLSFVPIVIAGVLIGGLLGIFYTNAMLTLLLSSAGIHNVQFIVHLPLILVICAGIIALAYFVSMLVSYGIRRISAYGLIAE